MRPDLPHAEETAIYSRGVVPLLLWRGAVSSFVLVFAVAGCGSSSSRLGASAIQPVAVATDVDPRQAEPGYWLAQPANATVVGTDFDRLFAAAERVNETYLFPTDRRDRREGVLTSVPVISPQWFEPWRRELQTADATAKSSVATIRRSVRWSFEPLNGGFVATPKVLIERQSLTEERVSGVLGRGYFQRQNDQSFGTPETDRNVILPDTYWYAIGRDAEFERVLAEKLRARLNEVVAR